MSDQKAKSSIEDLGDTKTGEHFQKQLSKTGNSHEFNQVLFEGQSTGDSHTPKDLGLKGKDVIEVYQEQTRGHSMV
uniref:Ubiquitin-like domain-containing protein n=1 Tax=Capra hircus TaxID=9925 RepID=A0A8C2P6E2_CAPHI